MNRLFFGLFAIQTTRTLPRTSVPQKHPISSPRVISRQPRGRSVSQFTGKFRLQPLRALLLIMGEDGCYELATPSQQAAPNQRSPFISLCLAPSPQGVRPAPGLPHLPPTSGKLSRVRGCRWLALDSLTHPLDRCVGKCDLHAHTPHLSSHAPSALLTLWNLYLRFPPPPLRTIHCQPAVLLHLALYMLSEKTSSD